MLDCDIAQACLLICHVTSKPPGDYFQEKFKICAQKGTSGAGLNCDQLQNGASEQAKAEDGRESAQPAQRASEADQDTGRVMHEVTLRQPLHVYLTRSELQDSEYVVAPTNLVPQIPGHVNPAWLLTPCGQRYGYLHVHSITV